VHGKDDAANYLGHGFRRVVVVQLGIHALPNFVLAQSRSGLDMAQFFFQATHQFSKRKRVN
jgi:hypothetical protein